MYFHLFINPNEQSSNEYVCVCIEFLKITLQLPLGASEFCDSWDIAIRRE